MRVGGERDFKEPLLYYLKNAARHWSLVLIPIFILYILNVSKDETGLRIVKPKGKYMIHDQNIMSRVLP